MKLEGYGHIEKLEDKRNDRCRKWKLRAYVGINPKTGKRMQRTRTFQGSLSEAKDALIAFREELDTERKTTRKKCITLAAAAEEWLKERKTTKQVVQLTIDKNRTHLNSWCHHLGKMPMNKIETYMITDAEAKLMEGDSPSGKPNSGTYIISALITLNMLFKWAMKRGYAKSNPVEDVPRPKNDTEEKKAIPPEKVKELLEQLDPTNFEDVLVALGLGAGFRRTEIALSQWKHFDLIDGTVLVPGTKTDAARAMVPLLDEVHLFLLDFKEQQRIALEKNELKQDEDTFVLTYPPTGEGYTAHAVGKLWHKRAKNYGLEGYQLHELRHSFATMLARNRVHPKIMQGLLRQKDERVALKIYTHVNIDDMRDSVERVKL